MIEINYFTIFLIIWGFTAWLSLSKLYKKYRLYQMKHGDIPYESEAGEIKQADIFAEGFLTEIRLIWFAELEKIKSKIILNPKTWRKNEKS